MSKAVRILVIFLAVDAVAVAAYFGIRALGSGAGADPTEGAEWFTMDAYYQPASELEELIKTSYEEMDLLPLQVRNFGRDHRRPQEVPRRQARRGRAGPSWR
ncbi:MAG: hypothetical protein M0C28_20885 [Candidatus Moduliflexus flocculans]|nr:hypothetical protein [Candidatus Moduliflexus flocculans]